MAVDARGVHYGVGFRTWEVSVPWRGRVARPQRLVSDQRHDGESVRYGGLYPAGAEVLGGVPLKPSNRTQGHPVFAFSHGDQAFGGVSGFMMSHMASHGWVAVAPDHTENLLWATVEPPPQVHWYHRPLDVLASLEALKVDEMLSVADTSTFAFAGHSRGASTAWTLAGATFDQSNPDGWCADCEDDQRALFTSGLLAPDSLAVSMGLAGTIRSSMFGSEGHLGVDIPFVTISGTTDPVGQEEQFETRTVDHWIDLEGACHESFTYGACPTLPNEEGWQLIRTYVLAMARYHVLGDRGDQVVGLVEGTEVLSDRVRVARTEP